MLNLAEASTLAVERWIISNAEKKLMVEYSVLYQQYLPCNKL